MLTNIDPKEIKILIIEDEEILAGNWKSYLQGKGYNVYISHDSISGWEKLMQIKPDILLLDLSLPPSNSINEGLGLLRKCIDTNLDTKVIIVTAEATLDIAITSIKQGAEDFLVKPINFNILLVVIERIIQKQRWERRARELQLKLLNRSRFGDIVGASYLMQKLYKEIEDTAKSDANVMIYGESGVGKGLVAQEIHSRSKRKNQPFIILNSSTLSDGTLESELFGHEKGSFTGAIYTKIGRFEYADNGTLFLDEISTLSKEVQAKMLTAVEDKVIQRVGGNESIFVDTRILSAANIDPKAMVESGSFRKDLFYRLNTLFIHIPPLRNRCEDIPLLADYFLGKSNNKGIKGYSQSAYDLLLRYDWPGNVRELKSVIERTVIKVEPGMLITPTHILDIEDDKDYFKKYLDKNLKRRLEEFEIDQIKIALKESSGNISDAAKSLGLTPSGLYKKIGRLRIRDG